MDLGLYTERLPGSVAYLELPSTMWDPWKQSYMEICEELEEILNSITLLRGP